RLFLSHVPASPALYPLPYPTLFRSKEEHLATGNRPSSTSKIRAGVSADGMLTAFDAETWGTGGAGAGAGFPLPYIYVFPNRRRRSEEHTSELQSRENRVCRLLLEKN